MGMLGGEVGRGVPQRVSLSTGLMKKMNGGERLAAGNSAV